MAIFRRVFFCLLQEYKSNLSPLKKEINIDILTITFGKSYADSNSKMAKEHKYKDKDNYKYEDKDKDDDAKTITGILTVCYIFRILMTCPVQYSTAQYSLVPPSTV